MCNISSYFFLVIDPFHWYTKSVSPLLQQQEKEIKRIEQQFADLNLASSLDNSNTIADLLWELKTHPNISAIVKETNEIKTITSIKDNETKLSSEGEEVNLRILVKTGSLEKEIDVKLKVTIENGKVKTVNSLVKYQKFLDVITKEIEADGIKRVSNLLAVIKTVIDKNDLYKIVFNGINYDIVNDKNDDEIIANGLKSLNLNFNFIENNKLISSSVKLIFDLKGKSRKEINQYLADNIPMYLFNYRNVGGTDNFFAQTVFANKSTYQDLINELVSFAPQNNFYLWKDAFRPLDNSDSKISIEVKVSGISNEDLTKKIAINSDKWWTTVEVNIHFFIGNGKDKSKGRQTNTSIYIIDENHFLKDFFLYISKLREVLVQGLFKYEVKAKMGSTYGELKAEFDKEIDRLKKTKIKPKDTPDINFSIENYYTNQDESSVISKSNAYLERYYVSRFYFYFDKSEITDSPYESPHFWLYVPVEEK